MLKSLITAVLFSVGDWQYNFDMPCDTATQVRFWLLERYWPYY